LWTAEQLRTYYELHFNLQRRAQRKRVDLSGCVAFLCPSVGELKPVVANTPFLHRLSGLGSMQGFNLAYIFPITEGPAAGQAVFCRMKTDNVTTIDGEVLPAAFFLTDVNRQILQDPFAAFEIWASPVLADVRTNKANAVRNQSLRTQALEALNRHRVNGRALYFPEFMQEGGGPGIKGYLNPAVTGSAGAVLVSASIAWDKFCPPHGGVCPAAAGNIRRLS
jgi:hypothetical protein